MHMTTRLEQFIQSRGLKPAHLARESGYSRQHVLRVRMGRMEPTRRCIAAIVAAARRLSREPGKAAELVDLGYCGQALRHLSGCGRTTHVGQPPPRTE